MWVKTALQVKPRHVLIPVLTYRGETWLVRKDEQDLLERIDIIMITFNKFRWIMGIKKIEKIRTEEIRKS